MSKRCRERACWNTETITITITVAQVTKQIQKMANWKAPGPDELQGYWLTNLIHHPEKELHLNYTTVLLPTKRQNGLQKFEQCLSLKIRRGI